MIQDKIIKLITEAGFWQYGSELNEELYFSNGNRQFTVINDKVYTNEHRQPFSHYMSKQRITSYKALKSWIEIFNSEKYNTL